MASTLTKVGLLGGSFNPVHRGHIAIARAAMRARGLDEVWFIPCAIPPHKSSRELVADIHRLRMLKLALGSARRFKILDWEIKRGGVSYSINTVKHLKQAYPSTEFYFIIGTDLLSGLHKWRKIKELLNLCQFLVVGRPRYKFELSRIRLPPQYRAKIAMGWISSPLVDISSEEIRKRIRKGLPIDHLVPKSVARYIRKYKLYKGKETKKSKL